MSRQHRTDQPGSGLAGGIINLVFGFIAALVGLRCIFTLLSANPDSGLVSSVYQMSAPLVAPFYTVLPALQNSFGGSRTDVAGLLALVVYGTIATVLSRLFIPNNHLHSS